MSEFFSTLLFEYLETRDSLAFERRKPTPSARECTYLEGELKRISDAMDSFLADIAARHDE